MNSSDLPLLQHLPTCCQVTWCLIYFNYLISPSSIPGYTDQSVWMCLHLNLGVLSLFIVIRLLAMITFRLFNHLQRHLFTMLLCSLTPPTMLDTIKLPDIPQIQTRLYRAIKMDLNSMKSLKASSAASFTLVRLFLSH